MAVAGQVLQNRGNATAAILQGGFRVDGEIVSKPHRQARPGQVLTFRQGERTRIVRVLELGARRGPASEAALLYEDLSPNPPPPPAREIDTAWVRDARDRQRAPDKEGPPGYAKVENVTPNLSVRWRSGTG